MTGSTRLRRIVLVCSSGQEWPSTPLSFSRSSIRKELMPAKCGGSTPRATASGRKSQITRSPSVSAMAQLTGTTRSDPA